MHADTAHTRVQAHVQRHKGKYNLQVLVLGQPLTKIKIFLSGWQIRNCLQKLYIKYMNLLLGLGQWAR